MTLPPEGAGASRIAYRQLPTWKPYLRFLSVETEVQRVVITVPKAYRSPEPGDSMSFPGTGLCL